MEQILEISKGLLTPVIAIITTYIAWQQWKTNQQKLKFDKYDRRLHVYEEVKKILDVTMRDADVSTADLLKFRRSVSEADFLFETEIIEYIDEVFKHGLNLYNWNQEYRDYTQEQQENYDHSKVVDGMRKEITWFSEQYEYAKEKFRKYLDLS